MEYEATLYLDIKFPKDVVNGEPVMWDSISLADELATFLENKGIDASVSVKQSINLDE